MGKIRIFPSLCQSMGLSWVLDTILVFVIVGFDSYFLSVSMCERWTQKHYLCCLFYLLWFDPENILSCSLNQVSSNYGPRTILGSRHFQGIINILLPRYHLSFVLLLLLAYGGIFQRLHVWWHKSSNVDADMRIHVSCVQPTIKEACSLGV
jgi:hypothetical protein